VFHFDPWTMSEVKMEHGLRLSRIEWPLGDGPRTPDMVILITQGRGGV
jgi:hypothetical protein